VVQLIRIAETTTGAPATPHAKGQRLREANKDVHLHGDRRDEHNMHRAVVGLMSGRRKNI